MDINVKNALSSLLRNETVPEWALGAIQQAMSGATFEIAGVTVQEHSFDASYLEFLDTQIALGTRGPEWTNLLKARKAALSSSVGEQLLRIGVRRGKEEMVAHWRIRDGQIVHVEIV